jgi:DNA polymerase-3 subunit delta
MRLRADQLDSHLQQGLKPVYLIHGDEALLVEEAADAIRNKLRQSGAEERDVWHVEGRFDWSQIRWQQQTMSLFSSHRIVEIRLPSASPGKDGGQALRDYADNPPEDTTLIIISGKMSAAQQKTKWFTELDRVGVTLPIWPVDMASLSRWISSRAQQRGLRINANLAALMAERVEGNLFAAAQEIDKLQLLCADGEVTESVLLGSVADNSRFEAFGLIDAVMAGEQQKIPHIIARLKAEGNDLFGLFSPINWSLQRVIDIANQQAAGMSLGQAFAAQKPPVWEKSQALIRALLSRHQPSRWDKTVIKLAAIDQATKGGGIDEPWNLLETLCLELAGTD